ncbi:MAG: glycosyltransferase family 2 protein [Muribaculaceae bacterium]|nr:glycosyltransferase family 2 protein [Muribaculaceae bacterium]
MSAPLISVIITSYNKGEYISQAISSIIRQTYSNKEIIVVDDCSRDNTLEICKQYVKDIKLIVNMTNQGLVKSRYTGVNAANGDFILFLDADDWLSHNSLTELCTTQCKYDADIVQMKIVWRLTPLKIPVNFRSDYDKSQAFNACLYNDRLFPVQIWGKLYRKDLLNDNPFAGYGRFWGEDRLLNLPIMHRNPKIEIASGAIYNYRWGGESVNGFRKEALYDYINVYKLKHDWITQNGYSCFAQELDKELYLFLNYYIRQMIDSGHYTEKVILEYLKDELGKSFWGNIYPGISAEVLYRNNKNSVSRKLKKIVKRII